MDILVLLKIVLIGFFIGAFIIEIASNIGDIILLILCIVLYPIIYMCEQTSILLSPTYYFFEVKKGRKKFIFDISVLSFFSRRKWIKEHKEMYLQKDSSLKFRVRKSKVKYISDLELGSNGMYRYSNSFSS